MFINKGFTKSKIHKAAQKIVQDKYNEFGKWKPLEKFFGLPVSTLESVAWMQHEPRLSTIEIILCRAGYKLKIVPIYEELNR